MNIVINSTKQISSTRQITYFTLTNDEAEDFRFHGTTPILSGSELQTYLDENIEEIYFHILMKQYPEADPGRMPGDTNLERMNAWIAAGAERLSHYRDGEPVYIAVEQQPFEHTHLGTASAPEYLDRGKISDESRDQLANATTIAALRTVLQKILLGI